MSKLRAVFVGLVAAGTVAAAAPGRARAADCDSNLMIVLDRSCSMTKVVAGDGRSKWAIAVDAIDKLTTDYADRLRFGLIMFPDESGANCQQDGDIYVNVDADTGAAVMDAVNGTNPDGPCVTNIDTAIGQVTDDPAFAPAPDPTRRSFVLLITDGKQSSACGGVARDPDTEALIADLDTNGFPTYVVGFGDGVRPASLETFALAGGVPRPGMPAYYQADTAAELDAAIAAIAGSIGGDPEFGCMGLPCPDGVCFGAGEVCEEGVCHVHLPDAGPTPPGADAGDDDDDDAGSGGGAGGGDVDTSGCGCAAGTGAGGAPGLALLVFAVALGLRRRRSA